MIYIDRIEVVNKLAPYAGISHPASTGRAVAGFTGPVADLSWLAGLPFSRETSLSVSISFPYGSLSFSIDPRCFQLNT